MRGPQTAICVISIVMTTAVVVIWPAPVPRVATLTMPLRHRSVAMTSISAMDAADPVKPRAPPLLPRSRRRNLSARTPRV